MAMDTGAEVDLGVPALLPEDYIPDVNVRLTLYKRLSTAADAEALRELKVEMIDRFGLLPPAAETLCGLAELRMRADGLGILRLTGAAELARVDFAPEPKVDPMAIIRLIQTQPNRYKFDGKSRLTVHWDAEAAEARLSAAADVLDALSAPVG